VRKGRKETEKKEKKEAERIGRTISRSFTVQKLEREIFRMLYLKTYHGVSRPTGYGLEEGQLASRVTREKKGVEPHGTQVGYQIVPGEGGELWGPFWNVYRGYAVDEGSALVQVWEVLEAEQRKIAEDLVFGKG
jgi:hypothetical protein